MAETKKASKSEGMFGKDKEIGNRIDGAFQLGEPFILWDAAVAPDKVQTEIGPARKTLLDVSRLDSPDERFACVSLASAIADKADLATPDDFPAVVELRKVKGRFGDNLALVIQYVRDYET